MDWFRVYDTIIDDPKILNLSMEFRWYFIAILASSSRQHDRGTLPTLKEIGVHLRTSRPKTERIVAYFIENGFIDQDPTTKVLMIHGWNKRQYKSDVSTDRVKRFRNACGNVSEVLPHGRVAQTELPRDRDRDRDRTPLPPEGERVVVSVPITQNPEGAVRGVADSAEARWPAQSADVFVGDLCRTFDWRLVAHVLDGAYDKDPRKLPRSWVRNGCTNEFNRGWAPPEANGHVPMSKVDVESEVDKYVEKAKARGWKENAT